MSAEAPALEIPGIGLGTWALRGAECVRTVREALELGYRHIDTAEMYDNEREVGRGLGEAAVSREEIFLTTKLWHDHLTRSAVPRSAEKSLERLGTDYVDLLLIHWPNDSVPLEETLEAMMDVERSGKARAIGVSNFPPALWRRALEIAPVPTNQVELHPFLPQPALVDFAAARGLRLIAYTPIAKGRVADDSEIAAVARSHGKTAAQVTLRWLVQRERVCAIPKAARREHLVENLDVFDFELGASEMKTLSGLGRGLRLVDPPWAPRWDPS